MDTRTVTRVAKWMVAVSVVVPASGCLSFLASLRCGDDTLAGRGAAQPTDCPALEDAAAEADDAIFEAVRSAPPDPESFANVELSGTVTDQGGPLPGAAVRLLEGEEVLLVARTDTDGRWALEDIVEKGRCDRLVLEVRHPDGRRSPPMGIACGARSVDWDFPPG